MKKKIFAVTTILVFALSMLTACGNKSEEKAKPVSAPAVKERQVYVTPKWVKSVIDKNQKGYEDYVVAEVGYPAKASKDKDFVKGHIKGSILYRTRKLKMRLDLRKVHTTYYHLRR